jgi:predicted dehydrogenase
MDGPIRVGVIGAGWFASRRHIPDIQRHEEATLAGLCRRDPAALERLAAHFGTTLNYVDWRRMLEECPLDAVLIATPHDLHYEPAREALQRGLHVLLEKPMTVLSKEARELATLAEAKGRVLSVALNPPFWAHCHRMRRAIQSGKIGEVESVSMSWTGNAEYVFGDAPKPADLPGIVPPTMYRADPDQCGGGYLIDGGSHLVSEVLWVTGLRCEHVSCDMDQTPSDRRCSLTLTLSNGAMATINSVGNSRHASRRVLNTIAGADGTIVVQGFSFQTTIQPEGAEGETFSEADLPPVAGPVANFVDAIRGRGAVYSPAEHGVHVVEVVEAAYQSAATGRQVDVG